VRWRRVTRAPRSDEWDNSVEVHGDQVSGGRSRPNRDGFHLVAQGDVGARTLERKVRRGQMGRPTVKRANQLAPAFTKRAGQNL
jgi:hypothetical protein